MRIKKFENYITDENLIVPEEENQYLGAKLLNDLASKLGVEVTDNQIKYNGKVINFYSETEMFHVDNRKFKTVDEVIKHLN